MCWGDCFVNRDKNGTRTVCEDNGKCLEVLYLHDIENYEYNINISIKNYNEINRYRRVIKKVRDRIEKNQSKKFSF